MIENNRAHFPSTHTPGPMRLGSTLLNPASDRCRSIIGPKGEVVAFVNIWEDAEEEGEANAKLLMAATDLLEACKKAQKRFDQLGMDWLGKGPDPLEAAIAKAEGRNVT